MSENYLAQSKVVSQTLFAIGSASIKSLQVTTHQYLQHIIVTWWSTRHKCDTKKKSESQQELNPWPPKHCDCVGAPSSEHKCMRTYRKQGHFNSWSSYVTGILHTARIGTDCQSVFLCPHSRGTKKKSLSHSRIMLISSLFTFHYRG